MAPNAEALLKRKLEAEWRSAIRNNLQTLPHTQCMEVLHIWAELRAAGKQIPPKYAAYLYEIYEYEMDRCIGALAWRFSTTPCERRLAIVVWAYRKMKAASELHPHLPAEPGMASAHAYGTILSDPERYMQGGEVFPDGVPENCDPSASGARWLVRLKKDIGAGKDRGEFIPFLLSRLVQLPGS